MMKKIPERYRRKISKDEINELPLERYAGEIRIVRSEEELADAVDRLRDEDVLGFDTETRPTFRKGKVNLPSLVQLACSDVVYLFQLNWLPFGEALASVLSDADIVKTGVAVRDDIRDLQKLFAFNDAGVVDLGEVARDLGLETHGLRNLAANFLEVRISKGAQCSNWSNRELAPQQVLYAATDAWVSREIHLRMRRLGLIAR
ncbi:3'-5' exonuclease domain-containing protein 2 [Desulfovibrio oxamicus]|uniref:3'-5' exonuclease domain-containing protein 2 n=2 Tax=Desulfovibrionaceae TaxID=194924 RepID=A0ABS0J325_9BACT|nr:3'-5' exonuclease domain-containing protein 2 [Nitratidesulfovibrio oxamicus]NHZ46344.1 3'-5' exonuclease domain-containing protein 2 [Nitratidesulfovibrio liaohensis]